MSRGIVLLLIVAFMTGAYFLNRWLQKIIKPRQSLRRLLLYMLGILLMIFIVSFGMVLIITWLYPNELIR